MRKFSPIQEEAINRRIKWFSPILEKGIPQTELKRRLKVIEEGIIQKRLRWYNENKDELYYFRCEHLTDTQKVFVMLFRHALRISAKDLRIASIYDSKQRILTTYIKSRNFCPYLEAFKRMNLKPEESANLCRLVLEKPCQVMIDKINPKIKFSRDYLHIRPLSDYCDERLILKDHSQAQFKRMQINIQCSLIGEHEYTECKENL